MDSGRFLICFEGYKADDHVIDMRLLGRSLVGFEQVISTGLIIVAHGRMPKQRERFPLVVRAHEPERGSFQIPADLLGLAALLPLTHQLFWTMAPDIIWHWISWVLLKLGGREKQADPHFAMLADIMRETQQLNAAELDKQRVFLLNIVDAMQKRAADAVSPVGPSADEVILRPGADGRVTKIDAPMADAIRSTDPIEVGDMQKMRIRVDGFVHHNRQLKIENPHQPGHYMTAQVRDPVFEHAPNVYTEAASRKNWLEADVKPTFKAGQLHGLYIFNAVPLPDPIG